MTLQLCSQHQPAQMHKVPTNKRQSDGTGGVSLPVPQPFRKMFCLNNCRKDLGGHRTRLGTEITSTKDLKLFKSQRPIVQSVTNACQFSRTFYRVKTYLRHPSRRQLCVYSSGDFSSFWGCSSTPENEETIIIIIS